MRLPNANNSLNREGNLVARQRQIFIETLEVRNKWLA